MSMNLLLLGEEWQWQRKRLHCTSRQEVAKLLRESREVLLGKCRRSGVLWEDLAQLVVRKGLKETKVTLKNQSNTVTIANEEVNYTVSEEDGRSGNIAEVKVTPWYALNKKLFHRVLKALHYVTYPNASNVEEWETTLKSLFHLNMKVGEVWCWLGQEEAKHFNSLKLEEYSSRALALPTHFAASSQDSSVSSSLKNLWSVEVDTYKNIFHYAVEEDDLPLIRRLCAGVSRSHINQTDVTEQTSLHLAASSELWRLHHLLVLVQHPEVNYFVLNRDSRTFIHCLLMSVSRRLRRNKYIDDQLLHQILALCLDTDPELKSVSDRGSGRGIRLALMKDSCGYDLLDYAIMSRVASVTSQVAGVLANATTSGKNEQCSSASTIDLCSRLDIEDEIDWSRYLKRAILCNRASIVIAIAEPFLSSHNVLLVDHDAYMTILSKILVFTVENSCQTALMALLTCKEFVRAINVTEELNCAINDRTQLLSPLMSAICRCKQHGGEKNYDILRILLKFGANPLLKPPHDLNVSCFHSPDSDRFAWLTSLLVCDYQAGAAYRHDNVYSLLVSQSMTAAGVADVLRALLLTTRHAACFVPSFTRRAQADEVAVTSPSSDNLSFLSGRDVDATNSYNKCTVLHFFFDYACFYRNPLVTVLLTDGLVSARRNLLHNTDYLRFHPFRLLPKPTVASERLKILEYLINHTPFVNLLDTQEGYSGLTPLSCACWTGNAHAVRTLLRFGANPWIKINATVTNSVSCMHAELSVAIKAWDDALARANCYSETPVFAVKKAFWAIVDYEQKIRNVCEWGCSALDSLVSSHLSVLSAVVWLDDEKHIDENGEMPYTLPQISIEFFNNLIVLLDLFSVTNCADSKSLACTWKENLVALREPSKLLCRARSVLQQHYQRMKIGNDWNSEVACGLNRQMLDRLRGMEKHYSTSQKAQFTIQSRKFRKKTFINTRIAQASTIKFIQNAIGQWSRGFLMLHSTAMEFRTVTEVKAGIALKNLKAAKHNLTQTLNQVMCSQRIHTAHNYVTQPSELHPSSPYIAFPSSELFDALFYTEPAVENDSKTEQNESNTLSQRKKQQELFQESLRYNATLTAHTPVISEVHCRRCVESFSRSDRLWWWDAVEGRDWLLVNKMIPDMCREESCFKLEQLLVCMIWNDAPLNLTLMIIRNGARLGATKVHLKLAIRKCLPDLLLALIFCGSYPTNSNDFWQSLLEVYRLESTTPCSYSSNDSIYLTCRRSSVRENKQANRELMDLIDRQEQNVSCRYNREQRWQSIGDILRIGVLSTKCRSACCESSYQRSSPHYLPQSRGQFAGFFSEAVLPLSETSDDVVIDNIDDDSSGSDSNNEAEGDANVRSFQKYHTYSNKESLVRSLLGQVTLLVNFLAAKDFNEGLCTVQGVLGLNGSKLTLPVIPSAMPLRSRRGGAYRSTALHEFWEKYANWLHPADRFLMSPSPTLLNTEQICIDGNALHRNSLQRGSAIDHHIIEGLISGLFRSCSRESASILIRALNDNGVTNSSMFPICFEKECPKSHSSEIDSLPAILYAARCGQLGVVECLLGDYLGYSSEVEGVGSTTKLKLGNEEFYRGVTPSTFEIDVAKMSHLITICGRTRASRAQQRRRNLISGLRGRFHHYTNEKKPCELVEFNGTKHMSFYSKIPVNKIFDNIQKLIDATLQLAKCEASWLTLQRTGVLSSHSSFVTMSADGNTHNHYLMISQALQMLGIHSAGALHKYISKLHSDPLTTCFETVQLMEGISIESTIDDDNVKAAPTVSNLSSLSLQPMKLWQAWIHAICQLLEDSSFVKLIWKELIDLHLVANTERSEIRDDRNSDSSHSLIDEWLSDDTSTSATTPPDINELSSEKSVDSEIKEFLSLDEEGWFHSAEHVFHEHVLSQKYASECLHIYRNVAINLRTLRLRPQGTPSVRTLNQNENKAFESNNFNDYYNSEVKTSPGDCWFHSAAVPLLCLDVKNIMELLLPTDTSMSIIDETRLYEISANEYPSLGTRERFRLLIAFAERLYEFDRNKNLESSTDDEGNAKTVTLLDLELRDTLMIQAENVVQSRINAIEDSLQNLSPEDTVDNIQFDEKASNALLISSKSMSIGLKLALEKELRVAKHFEMYLQTCRRQNNICLNSFASTTCISNVQNKVVTKIDKLCNVYQRLMTIISESIVSRNVSLLKFLLNKVSQCASDIENEMNCVPYGESPSSDSVQLFFGNSEKGKFGGISLKVWEAACACGDCSIVVTLLDFAKDFESKYGNYYQTSTEVAAQEGSSCCWTLVHCVMTGCTRPTKAAQMLQDSLLLQNGDSTRRELSFSSLNGTTYFSGECWPRSAQSCSSLYGYEGIQRRKIVDEVVRASPYFYAPCEADFEDASGYNEAFPCSVLDLCAAAGCWSSVDVIMTCSEDIDIFSLATHGGDVSCATHSIIPKVSLFLHHVVSWSRGDILDSLLKALMISKKSSSHEVYRGKLKSFAKMLVSKRQFLTTKFDGSSTDSTLNHHFLLHDALLTKNEQVIKKLIWITKSILDECDDLAIGVDYDVIGATFRHGIPCRIECSNEPSASLQSDPLLNNSLVHYAVLSGLPRVLRYILEVGENGHLECITSPVHCCIIPSAWLSYRRCRFTGLLSTQNHDDVHLLSPLQVALGWSNIDCLSLLLSIKNHFPADLATEILYDTFNFSRHDTQCAYIVHKCFVVPLLERTISMAKDSDWSWLSILAACVMCDENLFYSSRDGHELSKAKKESFLLALDSFCQSNDITSLIKGTFDCGWHKSCCLLMQCHFLLVLSSSISMTQHEDSIPDSSSHLAHQKTRICEFYKSLFELSGEYGNTTVCLGVLSLFHELSFTWLHPVTPPVLYCGNDKMQSKTFFSAFKQVASRTRRSLCVIADKPVTTSTSSGAEICGNVTAPVTPDDIFIDLNQFRNLLLAAEAEEESTTKPFGDEDEEKLSTSVKLQSSMRNDNVVDTVINLPEIGRENVDPSKCDKRDSLLNMKSSDSNIKGASSSVSQHPGRIHDPPSNKLPSLGTSKRIVVIRTKDGKKATFVVNNDKPRKWKES